MSNWITVHENNDSHTEYHINIDNIAAINESSGEIFLCTTFGGMYGISKNKSSIEITEDDMARLLEMIETSRPQTPSCETGR